jgi:hypothetical protein
MLTIISQRFVLRHPGIRSLLGQAWGQVASVCSKVDFVHALRVSASECPRRSVEGGKAQKRKGHRFKKRPSSNRTSQTIQKHSGTSNVSSTRSQVFISSSGMVSTRLPESRGRLHGSPKPIAQTISFGNGNREEEEERGGQGRQICKK